MIIIIEDNIFIDIIQISFRPLQYEDRPPYEQLKQILKRMREKHPTKDGLLFEFHGHPDDCHFNSRYVFYNTHKAKNYCVRKLIFKNFVLESSRGRKR